MPTLRDVARACNVTPMTVSCVLNNKRGRVSAATRERVLRAVRELNYHPNAIARGLACGVAAVLVFSPQIFVWELFYRQPFVVPQGDAFMRWTDAALGKVLFSDFHGLFSWTPLALVAVAGSFLLVKRDARAGWGVLLVFVASWYANAAAADWWAGEAFGARRFVSCFPLFVLGLSAVFDRLRARPAAVAGPRP